jgi:dihydroorotase
VNPRKRFELEPADETKDFAVWELEDEYVIDPETFLTKGRATPFEGWKVQGRCVLNVVNDKIVWKDEIK